MRTHFASQLLYVGVGVGVGDVVTNKTRFLTGKVNKEESCTLIF